jgi:hypothetical protein
MANPQNVQPADRPLQSQALKRDPEQAGLADEDLNSPLYDATGLPVAGNPKYDPDKLPESHPLRTTTGTRSVQEK